LTINRGIQIVELIKFEPVTLEERLDCISTRRMETRNYLFYLKNLSNLLEYWKLNLNCITPIMIII